MDPKIQRQMLVDQYWAFVEKVQDQGVVLHPLDEETLSQMSDADLQRIVRGLRDLARTPSS